MELKKKHLWLLIPLLLLFAVTWIHGNWTGYLEEKLNIKNGIAFCESNKMIMCSWNSSEIRCGKECNANTFLPIFSNPSMKLIGVRPPLVIIDDLEENYTFVNTNTEV